MKGKVYLVGAGPGDPELLTLKGKRLLQNCDVVVYDRLVSSEIMALIPESAALIDVGKNVGCHPVPQGEINKILLREALEGKTVVRLKGGDPFVFGRGGEELELLAQNEVSFEVVPGITSSIAAPAYGGIPVTHRNFCSSLHIITGHGKADSEAKIDFDSLVKLNGTLVFMMSVSTIGRIAKGLMDAGMEKDMPAAVIENGTRPYQRKLTSTLENIEADVKANKIVSPAVILVGRVCSLSDDFDWYSKLPLKGKKVIVTQPMKKNSKLNNGLRELGADTLLYPCIKTEYIRPIAPDFENYDCLVFTSGEGVNSFFDYLLESGKDARCIKQKIACIGKGTADALKKYGLLCDFIPSVYDGEHLAKEMVETGFIKTGEKVILLRAKIGTADITNIFDEADIDYTDYPVYVTDYISHEEPVDDYDLLTFTSKSCVEGFVNSQDKKDFSGAKALCIGKQTAEAAAKYNFDTIISDEATINSMIKKVGELL